MCLAAVLVADAVDGAGWFPHAAEPYQDAIVLGGFTLVLLALLWAVSAWTLRPLIRASAEASAVGPGNPGARISAGGLPAELRPLATAMNGALDRLAAALRAEQRFVANAAHELRTPLAVLDLRLRRARESGATDWEAVAADLAALTRRVTQLLDLARLEGGERPMARVNLARMAREAAAAVLPIAAQQGRVLEIDLPDELPVRGRADDLRDMVRNLLENALRHGRGTVRVDCVRTARDALLRVADEGSGVAPAEREAVFGRFHGGAGGGAGLGLAIVREVARGHGGSVAFAGGSACAVEVRLPVAAP